MVERGRAQMAISRMRIACWITEATDSHSEYVVLIIVFLPETVVKRTRHGFTFIRARTLRFHLEL